MVRLDQSQFVQPILNYYAIDDELRCMPFNSSTAMLYYNKDMFEAAGLIKSPRRPSLSYTRWASRLSKPAWPRT